MVLYVIWPAIQQPGTQTQWLKRYCEIAAVLFLCLYFPSFSFNILFCTCGWYWRRRSKLTYLFLWRLVLNWETLLSEFYWVKNQNCHLQDSMFMPELKLYCSLRRGDLSTCNIILTFICTPKHTSWATGLWREMLDCFLFFLTLQLTGRNQFFFGLYITCLTCGHTPVPLTAFTSVCHGL